MIQMERDGVHWFAFEQLTRCEFLIHGFSTRIGGVSESPFAELNLAFHVGDNLDHVVENRRRYCQALGLHLEDLTSGEQVHRDQVRVVTGRDRGCGAFSYDTAFPGTDGFITNESGVVLSSYYADCVPLFVVDPVQRVVGLAHAGWKGTVKRIGARTIETMQTEFGTRVADCLVGIGPSVGQCCYEVDEHVIQPLQDEFPEWEEFVKRKDNGRWDLDLWATNRQVFLDVGVPSEQIEVSGLCTACRTDLFFSYRAEQGQTGRMASILAIKP